jgi:hypothetical protein
MEKKASGTADPEKKLVSYDSCKQAVATSPKYCQWFCVHYFIRKG